MPCMEGHNGPSVSLSSGAHGIVPRPACCGDMIGYYTSIPQSLDLRGAESTREPFWVALFPPEEAPTGISLPRMSALQPIMLHAGRDQVRPGPSSIAIAFAFAFGASRTPFIVRVLPASR